MSWIDDIRCLYCDGRLPLYRKITNGQFCSTAHRKAYWQEHERLAVERLHQTHDSLRAYRPPGAVEAIFGHAHEPDEAVTQFDAIPPDMAGFVPNPVLAMPQWLPDYLAQIGVAPLESARILRRPVIVWAVRDAVVAAASHVHLAVPAVGGQVLLATAVAPIQPGVHAARPNVNLRLDLALWNDELLAVEADQIPELAERLAMALPVMRDYATLTALPDSPTAIVLRAQLPLHALGMRATLVPAALFHAGLSQLPVTIVPVARGALTGENLHALDLPNTIQAPHVELSTPPFRPRLNLACGSRYKVETRQGAPLAAPAEPAGFAAMPIQISWPQHKMRAMSAAAGASRTDTTEAPAEKPAVPQIDSQPDFEPSPSGLLSLSSALQLSGSVATMRPAPGALLLPQPPRTEPARPVSKLSPIDSKPISDTIAAATPAGSFREPPESGAEKAHLWTHAVDFWNRAPRDLKILAFALPVLLGLTLHPSLPKVRAAAPAAAVGVERNLQHAFNAQWANVRQTMLDRAAVALSEDFRSGLDEWISRDDATAAWSFDATGFVRPGPLALYRPSMELTDYQLQFLGMLDKQALSWVARAADYDNFYVIKLNVLKAGPLPTIGLTRYAVVNGVADSRADIIAPIDARADMLYRVRLDVHGNDFTLSVQDQMVDSWSEPRLRHGGIGFFSARGEESRLRWVQITHQYDMLGRLCAYLAPYNIPTTSEQ